jgi:hypothetical protein
MKKMKNYLILPVLFILASCSKNDVTGEAAVAATERKCATMEVFAEQMKADPTLEGRMARIEEFTGQTIKNSNFRLVNGVIEIPVVFNVIYKTTAQNVSQARLEQQIAVLNADFNATNADFVNVPALFQPVAANVGIRFVIEAVNRKKTTKSSFSTNNAVKKSGSGGLNPTNPTQFLNIWVCNLGNGILGYAQFPGGAAATDGVVLLHSTLPGGSAAPYNKGRTATHEVGHYLNLRHIWGDATCGSDQVSDTPTHNTANYGCPAAGHKSTCSGTPVEMTMNYMDYTDDACMYMFSNGQKARILSVFAANGPRSAMGM